MKYISTRNNKKTYNFIETFLNGLALDGGLYIPKKIPRLSSATLNRLSKLNYNKTYSTANGIITGASIRLDSMEIGAGIFKNVEAHLGSGNLDVSLLGMSVLERFKVFKIDRDMLILEY